MKLQSKKKSIWSSFKNAYLKNHNLKLFWKNLDKKKISSEFCKIMNIYINSESYSWSSRFWRRLVINHLKVITLQNIEISEGFIEKEYFTFTYFNESIIKDACAAIENNTINLNVNLFKKQKNFSYEESLNHNIILYLLYENIKNRPVFKNFQKILERKKNFNQERPSLLFNRQQITQDDLNSLYEYEKIEKMLTETSVKKNSFLEIGAGSGRTTATILSMIKDIKYVVADIPPAVYYSYNNIKKLFPEKKIKLGFEAKDQAELLEIYNKNDVIFIFPHQIEMLPDKIFDISIAIDCLHEMEKKIVEKYVTKFERVSDLFYFKVWEYAGLPNSFYESYSIHKNSDYFIKDKWVNIFKEKCIFPSNYYHVGYKF